MKETVTTIFCCDFLDEIMLCEVTKGFNDLWKRIGTVSGGYDVIGEL